MVGKPLSAKEQAAMSLFSRAHDIIAAKADKALDSAENPNEMLDYSYQQLLDQVTRVRRGLVDIAASRKRIELQEDQLRHTADHLSDQAQAALGQGREDLAREALTRKSAAQQQIDEFEAQRQDLSEQEEKLSAALGQLQERVNHFRSQKEVMKAQYTAAEASAAVSSTAAGINSDYNDTAESLARAQDKIANMQARAGAMDELLQSGVLEDVGGDTDDIQDELDKAGTAADVDQELAALKAKMAAPELPAAPADGGSASDH
jgi:phage shock protein A